MKQFCILLFSITLSGVLHAQQTGIRTGEYTASTTVLELVGEELARTFGEKVPVDAPVAWEVYVPAAYDPATPAGILVFINSRNSGKIEEHWKPVMDRSNLIWIGANNSGNDIAVPQRIAYAILAPKLIMNSHAIDAQRIYVSGFSGGGRVASMVATEYGRLFRGAIYNSGANFWSEAAPDRLEQMKHNRYVFIAGEDDFNLEDSREVHDAYLKSGITRSRMMVVPGMGHERPPAAELEGAIEYLDAGPR